MRKLFARIGVWQPHDSVGRPLVDVRFDSLPVGGLVEVIAECEAVERLPLGKVGLVIEIAEQVVEGAILAHHHDDVVEPRRVPRAELCVAILALMKTVSATGSIADHCTRCTAECGRAQSPRDTKPEEPASRLGGPGVVSGTVWRLRFARH